jgi:hypothetical protein
MPGTRILSVTAFHEKAGRSQGNSGFIVSSWFFSLTKVSSRRVATVAMLPSALSRSESFARCMLGVLVQPVLPSVWRPVVLLFSSGTRARPLTQSPELGFGFCLSLPGTVLFYAAVATVVRRLLCNGSYASPLTPVSFLSMLRARR